MAGGELACSVTECERLVGHRGVRGMCQMHYQRLRNKGNTDDPYPVRECAESTCSRRALKRGYCETHYQQFRLTGQTRPIVLGHDRPKLCVFCGATDWPEKGSRKYCSANCQALDWRHRGTRPQAVSCRQCGDEISLIEKTRGGRIRRADTKLCRTCWRAKSTRHRASVAEIANRDGTSCRICGEEIDMTLRFPDLFRASVDHIVPFANGGTHDPSNLQLAHLWCNQVKADREGFSLMNEAS